jgi:hypothetical protein
MLSQRPCKDFPLLGTESKANAGSRRDAEIVEASFSSADHCMVYRGQKTSGGLRVAIALRFRLLPEWW